MYYIPSKRECILKKTIKVLIAVIAIDYYCIYIDNKINKITRKSAAKKQL